MPFLVCFFPIVVARTIAYKVLFLCKPHLRASSERDAVCESPRRYGSSDPPVDQTGAVPGAGACRDRERKTSTLYGCLSLRMMGTKQALELALAVHSGGWKIL